jgi:hypothetical protein
MRIRLEPLSQHKQCAHSHANTDKPVAVALDGTVAVFFVNISRISPLLGANFIFQPSGRDRKEVKKQGVKGGK